MFMLYSNTLIIQVYFGIMEFLLEVYMLSDIITKCLPEFYETVFRLRLDP